MTAPNLHSEGMIVDVGRTDPRLFTVASIAKKDETLDGYYVR